MTSVTKMTWFFYLQTQLTSVTPLIMFCTWLQIVRTVASSFLLPHHLSTRSWVKKTNNKAFSYISQLKTINFVTNKEGEVQVNYG